MKKRIILIIVIILALAMIVTVCSCSVTTANLQNVQTASEVDESTYQPVTITNTFEKNTRVIYVTGTVNNAPEETVVTADWYYMEGAIEYIASVDILVDSTTAPFIFELSKPDMGWPVGAYDVDLLIDGELEQTVSFSVSSELIPVSIENIKMASEVLIDEDESYIEVITPTYSFTPESPIIYVVGDWYYATDSTVITANWYDEGEFRSSHDLICTWEEGVFEFEQERGSYPWDIGEYYVDILVDGQLVETISFTIY